MATADRLEREAQQRNPWPYIDKALADKKKADQQQALVSPWEDFSTDAPVEAAELDYIDTNRQLNAKAMRADKAQADAAADPLGSMYDYYAEESGYSAGQQFLDTQKALTKNWRELGQPKDVEGLQIWTSLISQAEEEGFEVTKEDFQNLVDWRKVNLASDRIAKLAIEDPNKNAVAIENIAASLEAQDPIYAALGYEMAMEKVLDLSKDPSIVDNVVAGAIRGLEIAMTPFIVANEAVMQSIRGGMVNAYDQSEQGGSFPGRNIWDFAYGATAGRGNAAEGKYNEEYIEGLYEATDSDGERLYSDLEIQIAFDLHKAAVEDPNFNIWDKWVEYAGNPEAQAVIGGILDNRGVRTTQLAELMRQIDSAHYGNTGMVLLGAADDNFSEARGGETRQDAANILGFGVSVLADPTIFGSKIYRGVQGARYALAALAPTPEGTVGAASLLSKGKGFGPIRLNNKTYRYFNALASDLNEYDDATRKLLDTTPGTTAHTEARLAMDGARARMARQYGAIPDDTLTDIIETVPRTDGKISVDDLATYIDDKNADYVMSYAAIEAQGLEMGVAVSELPRYVSGVLDDLGKESFDAALLRGGGLKRGDLAPQMTSLGVLRTNVANHIAATYMPTGRATKIMQRYVDSTNAKTIAKSMSDNAAEIGQASRSFKFSGRTGPDANELPSGEGLFDSMGRMFSSIAVDEVVDLTTGEGSKSVYRYARMFLPRKMAETVANAFREGDIGSRRLLLSGVVRAAAQSRGIAVSQKQADRWLETSAEKIGVTGKRDVEQYGASMIENDRPTRIFANSQQQTMADEAFEAAEREAASAQTDLPIVPGGLMTEREILERQTDEINRLAEELSPEEFKARAPQIAEEVRSSWRAQIADDEDLVTDFYNNRLRGSGDTVEETDPKDWIYESVPESGYDIPPSMPSAVGSAKGVDARFINDGTISIKTLSDIEEAHGVEAMYGWLYTGFLDNSGQYSRAQVDIPNSMVGRLKDANGNPIPGVKGVPEDWWSDFAVWIPTQARKGRKSKAEPELTKEQIDELSPEEQASLFAKKSKTRKTRAGTTRIAVPWARGGAKQRKADQELSDGIDLNNDDYLQFERALMDGVYDTELKEYIAFKRESAEAGSRFAPAPARKPVRGEFTEPAPIQFVNDAEAKKRISLSADEAGVESALHMDQTTNHMRLPTLADFEDLRKDMGMPGKGMYMASKGLEAYTSFWSIATLFGWRFSIRNAIEEWGMWFLTAGKTTDLAKGRMTSTARRRASREMYVAQKANGDYHVVWKPAQGLIGRTVEKGRQKVGGDKTVGAWQDEWSEARGFPGFFMRNIIIPALAPRTSQKALDDALVRYAAGDQDPWRRIVMEGLIGSRLGGRPMGSLGLMNEDDLAIVDMALGSTHAMHLLDDVAQSAVYLNSARNPRGLRAGSMALDEMDNMPPGVMPAQLNQEDAYQALNNAVAKLNKITPSRKVSGYHRVEAQSKAAVDQWHHLLRSVMQNDGEIGRVAVQGISDLTYGRTTTARLRQQIADAIRTDPTGEYRQRFSRLQTDQGIDAFAGDYLEEVLALFQKPDGAISTRLVDMFTDADGAYQGWSREELLLDDIVASDRVSAADLRGIPRSERPLVMMPETQGEQYIPYANSLPSLISPRGISDRAYMWMGRQNARLSREPIFWGNMIALWRAAKPRREQLSKAISQARGETWEELDDAGRAYNNKIASELVAKDVMDRAYELSLAFMDNPLNRSNLAWKARNFSRYYRASEDFYRRMRRMAVSNPEGYVKAALAYSLIDDTGFVYTDDYGDKYFVYPTNEITQKIINPIVGVFGGRFDPFDQVEPFSLGGKLLGLTPSADPMNMIPPVTSGYGQLAGALFFAWQPELGGLRALTMGQFNQPTGSVWSDLRNAFLPAGFKKLGDAASDEMAESQQADAKIKAIQTMSGWGMFDVITLPDGTKIPHREATSSQIKSSKEMRAAEVYATGLWMTKQVAAWTLPAYPRRIDNNVSDWARRNGIDNMTDAFYDFTDTVIWDEDYLKLVEEAVGEEIFDPWNYAMESWWKLKVNRILDEDSEDAWDGGSLLPYTIGSFEDAGDSTQKRANFRATEDTFAWYFDDKDGYKSFPQEHQSASLFLAPREGEFDYTGHYIAKFYLGTRVKKELDDRIFEVLDAEMAAEYARDKHRWEKKERELDVYSPTYEQDKRTLNAERDYNLEKYKQEGTRWTFKDFESVGGDRLEALAEVENMLSWMRTEKYGTPEEPGVLPEGSTEDLIQTTIDVYREAEQSMKLFPGNSQYEVRARNLIKDDRDNKYELLWDGNANVKNFVQSVLWNL